MKLTRIPGETTIHSALADFGLAPSGTVSTPGTLVSDVVSDGSLPEGKPTIMTIGNLDPNADKFVLPPRAMADRLVDLFFQEVWPMLPLIHEPTFRKRVASVYDDTRHNKQKATIPFLTLMNMVFAFGCDHLDLELSHIYELSQTFHGRASELIYSVVYDIATLEVVQALHLVTLHLNSNMQFNRMWTSTGVLVRTAQALGLHLDPSDWNISTVEKELRKRLWWSIYALDR